MGLELLEPIQKIVTEINLLPSMSSNKPGLGLERQGKNGQKE